MLTPTPRTPRASLWFNRLLRWTYGRALVRAYNIETRGTELFRTLRPPYVLIPNHVSLVDPFVVGTLVPDPVHWITGDGSMRSSVMRALLSLVGSIPKSKAIPDLETVGNIVRVVRKAGGAVGIFAEGQSTWNGCTQPIYPSTAKLLALLKVPVVVPVLKGLYLSSPRWGTGRRRGRVEVEFKLVLTGDDCRSLAPEEIADRLEAALAHDEYAWLAARPQLRFGGAARASGLERGYFLCPRCLSLGNMRSGRRRVDCLSCGAAAEYTGRGELAPISGAPPLGPRNLRDWDALQGPAFARLLAERAAAGDEGSVLMEDSGVVLFRGKRFSPLVRLRAGRLSLHRDRLVFTPALRRALGRGGDGGDGGPFTFSLEQIEGIGTLKSRTVEFYVGRTYYRLVFPDPRCSARKWQAAVEFLQDAAAAAVAAEAAAEAVAEIEAAAARAREPGRAFYF